MKERQRWQPEEDALLRAYVKQYGPKEWNLISQRMGGKTLDRDPKSCLERWKNYLKPGIKKGSLTADEQSLVISLQAKYGNKWKKIAAEVPGRTAKRLGKWWEVFREKQLKKSLRNNSNNSHHHDYSATVSGSSASPDTAAQGKYDHILETFAEKYVQPNNNNNKLYPGNLMVPYVAANLPLPEPSPILSLASGSVTLPPWTNTNTSSTATTTTTSLTSSSSTSLSPSVSLTLLPADPAVLDPIHQDTAFQMNRLSTLVKYIREVEEAKVSLTNQRKEARWRLSRVEQQLEAEKARRRREKTEEIEARIRYLREEETASLSRLEGECREQFSAMQRDAETKDAVLMEAWCGQHEKLRKLIERIGGSSTGMSDHRNV